MVSVNFSSPATTVNIFPLPLFVNVNVPKEIVIGTVMLVKVVFKEYTCLQVGVEDQSIGLL